MSIVTTSKQDGSVTTSFVGCVLAVYSESVQVMSDIFEYHTYARVFDNEAGTFKSVFLRSDYYPESSDKREATVDASDEIKALYECHQAALEAKKTLERAEADREEALRAVRCPSRGKTVKVVRGRKVAVGTVAECTWFGMGRGYMGRSAPWRVGLKVDGQVVYTDAKNVEVVVG